MFLITKFNYFRWNFEIFKDNMHFYFMLGAVPIAVGITAVNVLQGPAVLKPIPEGTHLTLLILILNFVFIQKETAFASNSLF